MKYFMDHQRHLVCVPYSIENLHKMAKSLGIKRCWFHKDHYDVPKLKMYDFLAMGAKIELVRPRDIFKIINE